ncbi:methyltransferase domain-containing protein [Solicola gregarius]|uniref:Methyltransferase domain-containing protein n=1 Tax=Solicola gregarius TaxID=2908642 RepID=A0AA46YL60_9ACTN|nr:methyltransferase domain-containing protein [Solicola gregarius]UYM06570.1 methyltransferase domain-containing protein [Solicola gregarius]
MPQWSPTTYLRYAGERGRPFVDLVARVPIEPGTIVDLGCGPGQLSDVLRTRWPRADILGVDSSPEMIERARRDDAAERTSYVLGDIATWQAETPVDLIVSNAAFQWVPDQLEVIPRLREHVAPGGVLAFQVPNNFGEPSHVLLRELAADPRFAPHLGGIEGARGVDPSTYLDLLAADGWSIDVWETTYFHVLEGDDPVFAWVSGTGARPFLQALPDELRGAFEADYRAALRDAYPKRAYGTVLPFQRVFVVARREV